MDACCLEQVVPGPVHATLNLMQPVECAPAEREIPFAPHERPWLFSLLIVPAAVISIGLVSGALSYLLRDEGLNPARAASIVALLTLPHTIYFFWGPITDFFVRRRTWLMLAAAAAAATLAVAFHQTRLASGRAVALIFLGACFSEFVVAACGGMMGTLRSETNRRRAASFYQSGSLAFGAIAIFVLVSLSGRLQLGSLGWIVAAMVALPSLAALAAPPSPWLASTLPAKPPRASGRSSKPPFCAGKPFPTRSSLPFPCAAAP